MLLEAGAELRFAGEELLLDRGFLRVRVVARKHELEGDPAVEGAVARLEHGAHGAAAELADQRVLSEGAGQRPRDDSGVVHGTWIVVSAGRGVNPVRRGSLLPPDGLRRHAGRAHLIVLHDEVQVEVLVLARERDAQHERGGHGSAGAPG